MPPLLPEVVLGWSSPPPDHVAFFGQARQGLLVLVEHLLRERASRVFVLPAYTCPSVPQAIEQGGGRCVFVDLDDSLDFDWGDLTQQLRVFDPKDVVLLATSLFGAPVRDYKRLFPAALVVEDRSQSVFDPERKADFQVLSFGPGKMLSLGGGGGLVGRLSLPSQLLQCKTQSLWRLPLAVLRTVVQDQVFKQRWIYRWVAPLLPLLLKNSGHNDTIEPAIMHPWHARWAWFAMRRVPLERRKDVGHQWLKALPSAMCYDVPTNTPWLRLPVKLTKVPAGLMDGSMYADTVQKAQAARQQVLLGAQRLVACGLLPVHAGVRPAWLLGVAHGLVELACPR